MFDMGDLREGYWFEDAAEAARELAPCDGEFLSVVGVGANFSCASGVLPSEKNLTALAGAPSKRSSDGSSRYIPAAAPDRSYRCAGAIFLKR